VDAEALSLSDCGRIAVPALNWAVAHTHSGAEQWAEAGLNRAGYETYLPVYVALTGVQRRVTSRPLFPRYLFFALPPGRGWVAARYTPGVHKLCTTGGRPNRVPEGAVEALQATEAARRQLPAPFDVWRPGAPCRLANGSPLDGIDAVVRSVDGHNVRVHVLMFGELRDVLVKAECLVLRRDS